MKKAENKTSKEVKKETKKGSKKQTKKAAEQPATEQKPATEKHQIAYAIPSMGDNVFMRSDGVIIEVHPETHSFKKLVVARKPAPRTREDENFDGEVEVGKPNLNYNDGIDTFEGLDCSAMDLKAYQRYLKDHFDDEDCPIKNHTLRFRGYRISCTADEGFVVEDMLNRYERCKGNWEGIPTPEELGAWIESKAVKEARPMTAEEMKAAIERGNASKEAKRKAAADKAKAREELEKEASKPIDFEKLRKEVLKKLDDYKEDAEAVNLDELIVTIPFKRWKRKAKALLKQLRAKEIRRVKFIKELREFTENETFVVEEKNHRSTFVGTTCPTYKKVGYLEKNMIEVDGKWIEAVPFLMNCLLWEEKRCMSQLMKFARKEITVDELLADPLKIDWKEDFKPRLLENTEENAMVLSLLFDAAGLIAPQDLLYETSLKVGDVILLWFPEEGKMKRRTIAKVEGGVEVGRGCGILKTDKWLYAPVRVDETKKKEDEK